MNKWIALLLLSFVTGSASAELKTGFEKSKPGEIRELKTEAGVWTAAAGHAEVTAGYHYTGKQCLHIFGGKERMIEFTPAKNEAAGQAGVSGGTLDFAQSVCLSNRGTRERQMGGTIQWRPRGGRGAGIQVARVHSRSRNPERLRFICTSPERSGILLDDIALLPAGPAKITLWPLSPCRCRCSSANRPIHSCACALM